MSLLLANSNSLHIPLADKSAHCVITSPPYYSQRKYVGGQVKLWDSVTYTLALGAPPITIPEMECALGHEKSPLDFVGHIVAIFREVYRVLRDDGSLWLNFGDVFWGSGKWHGHDLANTSKKQRSNVGTLYSQYEKPQTTNNIDGLKDKDIVGIPWMIAFALREDGWYLRSDLIWAKGVSGQKDIEQQVLSACFKSGISQQDALRVIENLDLYNGNPMPESVKDRPSRAHEYIFLLSKSKKYYYDAEAIADDSLGVSGGDFGPSNPSGTLMNDVNNRRNKDIGKRNRRSVWEIPTQSYRGDHYAAYPDALVAPCIKAGTSEYGVCAKCGKPYERVTEKSGAAYSDNGNRKRADAPGAEVSPSSVFRTGEIAGKVTAGWRKTCNCDTGEVSKPIILDPFVGSGTTLLVARKLGRSGVGLDLSFKYLDENARNRLYDTEEKRTYETDTGQEIVQGSFF